jgi:allantoicase
MGKGATADELEKAEALSTDTWETLIPMTPLGSGYPDSRHNFFEVKSNSVVTYLRLNMFPDGGIARIRVYGTVATPKDPLMMMSYNKKSFEALGHPPDVFPDEDNLVDLMAMENGSSCLAYSDAHYGHPRNLAKRGTGRNMGDGWETARRLDRPAILKTQDDNPDILEFIGSEWAIFKLGKKGIVSIVVVDTNHFKGNYPDSISIQGAVIEDDNEGKLDNDWPHQILPAQKLGPHKLHFFGNEVATHDAVTHVRITIKPDGGISRIRLLSKI